MSVMRWRRAFLTTLLCLSAASSLPRAQQKTAPQRPAQPPQFRSGVDLIEVDVAVLDKNRQPVHGLAKTDFTVVAEGKPQAIEAFSEINVPDPVEPTTTWMRNVSSDV